MTLVELSIGLLVTSIVLAALSAVWYAVARTWSQNTGSQATTLTAAHANGRIEQIVRQSKYVIQYRRGSLNPTPSTLTAQVLFWRYDGWNPYALRGNEDKPSDARPDGAAQMAELALLEHDPAARRLYLYRALPAEKMSLDQGTRAGIVATWTELTASAMPDDFKKFDFVQRQVFCEGVDGAVFNVPSWGRTARPAIEYTLRLARGRDRSVSYGLASLRGPTTRPR
jgi:hypothetical protein